MDDLERAVINFIAVEAGYKPEKLSLDSRINHDLGVYGDDAFEIMKLFHEKFHVNLSDFEISRYFAPEGLYIISDVMKWLFSSQYRKNSQLRPLYIRDMVEAARCGRWINKEPR